MNAWRGGREMLGWGGMRGRVVYVCSLRKIYLHVNNILHDACVLSTDYHDPVLGH